MYKILLNRIFITLFHKPITHCNLFAIKLKKIKIFTIFLLILVKIGKNINIIITMH